MSKREYFYYNSQNGDSKANLFVEPVLSHRHKKKLSAEGTEEKQQNVITIVFSNSTCPIIFNLIHGFLSFILLSLIFINMFVLIKKRYDYFYCSKQDLINIYKGELEKCDINSWMGYFTFFDMLYQMMASFYILYSIIGKEMIGFKTGPDLKILNELTKFLSLVDSSIGNLISFSFLLVIILNNFSFVSYAFQNNFIDSVNNRILIVLANDITFFTLSALILVLSIVSNVANIPLSNFNLSEKKICIPFVTNKDHQVDHQESTQILKFLNTLQVIFTLGYLVFNITFLIKHGDNVDWSTFICILFYIIFYSLYFLFLAKKFNEKMPDSSFFHPIFTLYNTVIIGTSLYNFDEAFIIAIIVYCWIYIIYCYIYSIWAEKEGQKLKNIKNIGKTIKKLFIDSNFEYGKIALGIGFFFTAIFTFLASIEGIINNIKEFINYNGFDQSIHWNSDLIGNINLQKALLFFRNSTGWIVLFGTNLNFFYFLVLMIAFTVTFSFIFPRKSEISQETQFICSIGIIFALLGALLLVDTIDDILFVPRDFIYAVIILKCDGFELIKNAHILMIIGFIYYCILIIYSENRKNKMGPRDLSSKGIDKGANIEENYNRGESSIVNAPDTGRIDKKTKFCEYIIPNIFPAILTIVASYLSIDAFYKPLIIASPANYEYSDAVSTTPMGNDINKKIQNTMNAAINIVTWVKDFLNNNTEIAEKMKFEIVSDGWSRIIFVFIPLCSCCSTLVVMMIGYFMSNTKRVHVAIISIISISINACILVILIPMVSVVVRQYPFYMEVSIEIGIYSLFSSMILKIIADTMILTDYIAEQKVPQKK